MAPRQRPAVVAVINTSPDVVDMLRITLEQAGFVVVSLLTHQIRDGEVDVETFLRQHKPDVIVYDIAPPYDANYRLFEHLSELPELKGCELVLTSTNAQRVAGYVGPGTRVFEVVGKPFDLDEIVSAVKDAAHARPTR